MPTKLMSSPELYARYIELRIVYDRCFPLSWLTAKLYRVDGATIGYN